jgi:type IV secretory pathway VirB10-like protein
MEEKNNSIEEQTIPSLTEETKKAQGVKRAVWMSGIALVLVLMFGSMYLAKGVIANWFHSVSTKGGDHSKAASGVDLKDAQPRDLEAEIPKAEAPQSAAPADQTQQPTNTAAADNSPKAKFDRMLHGQCKNTGITYDIHGNPVVVCTDNNNPAQQPTAAAPGRTVPVFNRLNVPLAVSDVKSNGGGYFWSSTPTPGGATGAAYPSGMQPLKQLNPNEVVNDYLQRLHEGRNSADMQGTMKTAQVNNSADPASKDSGVLANSFASSHLSGVRAAMLGDLNYIWPKGQGVDCVMDGAIDASVSGYVGCTVGENVYSANGRTVLVEKGSTAFLEYHGVSAIGQTRFPLIASSIRTPAGVTFNLDSGAQGPLGETGASGYVDNRWGDRLGAAMLVAILGDVAQYEITKAQNSSGGTNIYQQSENVAQSIPGKVLDTTINIKPRILKLQGETVRIVAARDVDFSSVYKLVAK